MQFKETCIINGAANTQINIEKFTYYVAPILKFSLLIPSEEILCQSYTIYRIPQISAARNTNTGISTESTLNIVDKFVEQVLRNTLLSL